MRKIIVHHHIFKNAGSSIDHSLRASFGERWGTVEGEFPWSTLSERKVVEFLNAYPNYCAISSHQARILRTPPSDFVIFPIILIRNPIDRIGSCYEYERVTNSSLPSSVAAQKGIRHYVEFCLNHDDKYSTQTIRNYQTLHLSTALEGPGDPRKVLADDSDLKDAMEYINSIPVFGLVEKFNDSLELFKKWLSPFFPSLIFYAVKVNSTARSGESFTERIASIRVSLGERLWERVNQENVLDVALYEFAVKKFFTFHGK